jgi:DNA-binding NtrC family response regulator
MAKILLVEDDIPLMRLYESALGMEHEVVTAETSQQAIQAINEQQPDLMILDLNLPDAPGTTILKHLQSLDSSQIRVVIMTGFSHYRVESLPDMVVQVIAKPVTTSMLMRIANAAIASKV